MTDVDECSSNSTNDCPLNSVCVNTYGTYFCVSGVTKGHRYTYILLLLLLLCVRVTFCYIYKPIMCPERKKTHFIIPYPLE